MSDTTNDFEIVDERPTRSLRDSRRGAATVAILDTASTGKFVRFGSRKLAQAARNSAYVVAVNNRLDLKVRISGCHVWAERVEPSK